MVEHPGECDQDTSGGWHQSDEHACKYQNENYLITQLT